MSHRYPIYFVRNKIENILHNHKRASGRLPLRALLVYLEFSAQHRCRSSISKVFDMISDNNYKLDLKLSNHILEIFYKCDDAFGMYEMFEKMKANGIKLDSHFAKLLLICLSKTNHLDEFEAIVDFCKREKIDFHREAGSHLLSSRLRARLYDETLSLQVKEPRKNKGLDDVRVISGGLMPKADYSGDLLPWLQMVLRSITNKHEQLTGLEVVEKITRNVDLYLNRELLITVIDCLAKESVIKVMRNTDLREKILKNLADIARKLIIKKPDADENIITAFAMLFQRYDNAPELTEKLLKLSVYPNGEFNSRLGIKSYHRLLGFYLNQGNMKAAYSLYIHLTRFAGKHGTGIAPDVVVVHLFLVHFLKHKQKALGLKMYEKMLQDGAVPNERILKTLMELTVDNHVECEKYWRQLYEFCSSKNAENSENLDDISFGDGKINANYFRPIFVSYVKVSYFNSATKILQLMRKLNYTPTYSMYISIAIALLTKKENEHASLVLQLLKDVGHFAKPQVFNMEMKAWSQEGDYSKMESVLPLMKSHNLEPNAETFSCLIMAYLKSNQIDKALVCYHEMQKRSIPMNILEDLFNGSPISSRIPSYNHFTKMPIPKDCSFFEKLFQMPPKNRKFEKFPPLKKPNLNIELLLEELSRAKPVPKFVDYANSWKIVRNKYGV